MVESRVSTTTGEIIRQLSEACVERCESRRRRIEAEGATEEQVRVDLNGTTLDYFIGACAMARALGIMELVRHLEVVIFDDISKFGYLNVPKAALKRPVN